MTMNCDTLAVMFTDVSDAERVYTDFGDAEARRLGARCLKLVAEAARRNGGRLIKTIGDGAMMSFRSVEEAYRAASIIQLAMRDQVLKLKVGMHFGQVIETGDDVFGDTVNVAARVLARSGPGEILMTRECVDTLGPLQRATVRLLDTTSVKGRPELVEIFRVIGDRENVTTVVASSARPAADETKVLVLAYKDQTVRLEMTGSPIQIGREAGCDLVIASAWASRRHAKIEVQGDRFVITDHSSNGTFVSGEDGAERFLKRETQQLAEHGVISVGINAAGNPRDLVHYRCETATKHDRRSAGAYKAYHEGVTILAESDGPVTVFRTPSLAGRPAAIAG
ncbi:MAG TPA: adenylate/guanylate cyclase domain-containing protein [Burkholderiales bacterium]|nr:adenylate/guanylate cyclase domain-containing protein [Burkholderiales bacterium]